MDQILSDLISFTGLDIESLSNINSFKDATFEEINHNDLKISTLGNSANHRNSLEHSEVSPVYADDIASVDGGILDNCGIIPNNCLPCLVPTEKKGSLSSSPLGSRRKSSLRLSFKWRSGEGQISNTRRKLFNFSY